MVYKNLKELLDLLVMAAVVSGDTVLGGLLSLVDIITTMPPEKQYDFSKMAHTWLKANSEDFEKFSTQFDAKHGVSPDVNPDDLPPNIQDFLSKLK